MNILFVSQNRVFCCLNIMSHSKIVQKQKFNKHMTFNIQHLTFRFHLTFDGSHMAYGTYYYFNTSFMFPLATFANILLLPVPGCAWLFLSCRKFKAHNWTLPVTKLFLVSGSNLHTNAQSSRSQIIKLIKTNTRKLCLTVLLPVLESPSMGIDWLQNFRCETFMIRSQYA